MRYPEINVRKNNRINRYDKILNIAAPAPVPGKPKMAVITAPIISNTVRNNIMTYFNC
jgi:hypothetical protein